MGFIFGPLSSAGETIATAALLVSHVASVVTIRELPSESAAVAVSWTLCPTSKGETHPDTFTAATVGAAATVLA